MSTEGLDVVIDLATAELFKTLDLLDEAFDPDDIAKGAVAIILNHTRQRFLQEQDPDGHPWPPSQAAINRRSASGKGGTGTLFDTGTLWRSIQEPEGSGGQLGLFGDIAERVITAGAYNKKGEEYGKFHQYGTKYLPIRRFMGINPGDQELVEKSLAHQAEDIMRQIRASRSAP